MAEARGPSAQPQASGGALERALEGGQNALACRSELVALLLNFLKECHLGGRDEEAAWANELVADCESPPTF